MKNKLIIIAIAAIFSGCSNNDHTTYWIKTSKKPIICRRGTTITDIRSNWTLIDADGNIYYTGATNLEFPDTIFQIKK